MSNAWGAPTRQQRSGDLGAPDRQQAGALLQGLNDSQRSAVLSEAPRLRVLAGAGSGKTRVLTHRIAYGAAVGRSDPARVLAVTFTRKAAAELRERLARLGLRDGVQAGTFHAIAYAQLRQRWEERGVRAPELLERKVGFVARLCHSRDRTLPLDVVAEIEWASARLVEPERYEEAAARVQRRPPIEPARVAEIYARYRDAKKKRRLVDFDDLLRLAARDLATDPVYATARRWRFRHLYVDEFQDVNALQHQLLSAWMGPESTMCAVGDPNQAIYAWNGADARYLVDFDRFFPDNETVTLSDNYRSTPEILAAANAVLGTGAPNPLRLRPNRPNGVRPQIHAYDNETAEAQGVVRNCRDHRRPGDSWSLQAVLVRTNSQAAVLAEAFRSATIPHRLRGSGTLLEQPEVKNALNQLRRSSSVATFLADCERDARIDELSGTVGEDRHGAGRAGEGGWTAEPEGFGLSEERRANLAELVRLGREYLALDPNGAPAEFYAWLSATLRTEDRPGGDAVDIVTFHAAKGLEWRTVHVAGIEKGFVPIHHAEDDPEAIDEERRLLYVALTRARDELLCSFARNRAFGSRTLRRKPSPWIDAIRAGLGDPPTRATGAQARDHAGAARRSLPSSESPRSADLALFEALRTWRRAQAAKAAVPAYVIFNDATLRAVAESRPSSNAQLLALRGIGAVKAQRFGAELLNLVAEHADGATRP